MHSLKLPKGYLSFTQIDTWLKSKETYRKKYYGGVSFATTPAMAFGNEVTEAMERGEEWVSFIPRFPVFERKLEVEVDGVPFIAYIDNSDPTINAFAEQKTGRTKWTENKVKKHKQLPFYSTALQIADGFVQDLCYLVDVRTEVVKKTMEMNGIIMEGDSTELRLTGEFTMNERVISQEERDEARELIVKVGREIAEDFPAMRHLYE